MASVMWFGLGVLVGIVSLLIFSVLMVGDDEFFDKRDEYYENKDKYDEY